MLYSAFISYSYKDRHWAKWLHRALETYKVPKRLRQREGRFGPVGQKLPPVFRDRDELAASADLGKAVNEALAQSATLIVICSPRSAKSRWVNEEIRAFIALGRRDSIFCLIVDGEPHSPDPAFECLPVALTEDGIPEPLAADVRKDQDGRSAARLKLISGIFALPYDELRHREGQRRQRRLMALAAAAGIGFVVMASLTVFALYSRQQALHERDIARQQTMTAERTGSFVKSLFKISDPSEAQGSKVTAREILDRGAAQIRRSLADMPAVRAEMAATLGEVYGSLGLYREADALLQWSQTIPHGQPDVEARQLVAMADSSRRMGEYEQAAAQYGKALAIERRPDARRVDLIPRILAGLAESESALGKFDLAERHAQEALRLDRKTLGDMHPDVARDMEVIGLNALFDRDYAKARPFVERALIIRRATEGPLSPSVSDNIMTLGSIAYGMNDLAAAERYYRSRLAIDEKVLGPRHPDVAITLNNIARVLIDRRSYRVAKPLLDRALSIDIKERGESHDDTIYVLMNLAITDAALGQVGTARQTFLRALSGAQGSGHPMLGPILTDFGRLQCETGDVAKGMKMIEDARKPVREDYPDMPWRTAWVDNSRAVCLRIDGQRAQGNALIRSSSLVILKRWAKGTHYADLATRYLARR